MTTTTSPAGARTNTPAFRPTGRLQRLAAPLAPYATAVRVAGGVLTIVGAFLPWATFVLNAGPYPEKATLQFFVDPLGVTGFRLHLLLFGIAAIALALAPVPARGRMLRGVGWGIVAISVLNGLYLTVEGGGLGAITAAGGAVAFGALVTLVRVENRGDRLRAHRDRHMGFVGPFIALPVEAWRGPRRGRRA